MENIELFAPFNEIRENSPEGIKLYLRVKKLVIICVSFLSSEGYSKECGISRLKSQEVLKLLHSKTI